MKATTGTQSYHHATHREGAPGSAGAAQTGCRLYGLSPFFIHPNAESLLKPILFCKHKKMKQTCHLRLFTKTDLCSAIASLADVKSNTERGKMIRLGQAGLSWSKLQDLMRTTRGESTASTPSLLAACGLYFRPQNNLLEPRILLIDICVICAMCLQSCCHSLAAITDLKCLDLQRKFPA